MCFKLVKEREGCWEHRTKTVIIEPWKHSPLKTGEMVQWVTMPVTPELWGQRRGSQGIVGFWPSFNISERLLLQGKKAKSDETLGVLLWPPCTFGNIHTYLHIHTLDTQISSVSSFPAIINVLQSLESPWTHYFLYPVDIENQPQMKKYKEASKVIF